MRLASSHSPGHPWRHTEIPQKRRHHGQWAIALRTTPKVLCSHANPHRRAAVPMPVTSVWHGVCERGYEDGACEKDARGSVGGGVATFGECEATKEREEVKGLCVVYAKN